MHKNLDISMNILYQTNKTSPCSKYEISEKLNTYPVMPHTKFEEFLL